MRILVTGGSGFLGLALTDTLARRGDDVVSADLSGPPSFARDALSPQVKYRHLDVVDGPSVAQLVANTKPELIIHAAAATPDGAREAAGDAAAIVAANVGGTANIVEAAAQTGGVRVIALSSVAVYGRTLDDCAYLHEDMPPRPQILYGITKYAAETLALRLGQVHDVPVCAPRVGILWGAWEHRTALRATPSPAFAMFEAAQAGADIVLPQAASAPLLHVQAAVDGLLALIDSDASGIINLGAPVSVNLLALARAVARHYGVAARIDADTANIPLFTANRPPTDNGRLTAATGHVLAPYAPDLIAAHADWLDTHKGATNGIGPADC